MDTTLSVQVQETLDVLAHAQAQAKLLAKTMKRQRVEFGAGSAQIEDDLARVVGKIRYVKRLAEHKEHVDAATERTTPPD